MTIPADLHRPTPQSVARYVKQNSGRLKKILGGMHHHGPATSVREADYKGHHIQVRTTYEIQVDGTPVSGQFLVTDEGQVQCHALPNYTFLSALDLVKALIDAFPEDFQHSGDGGHPGHGGGMPGMRHKPSSVKTPARRKRAARGAGAAQSGVQGRRAAPRKK
jgi:hypothetical protein